MTIDEQLANALIERAKKGDRSVLRSAELKSLYDQLKTLPDNERKSSGLAVNKLRQELESHLQHQRSTGEEKTPIDVTAPWDVNTPADAHPAPLPTLNGSVHPLMSELEKVLDIFVRMGFAATESRQIDNEFNMFTALNFPEGHPARDDYDTFVTSEGLIAPAHTSTMQNRVLKENKHLLEKGQPIAYIIPGRVFRNEDVDARHEHTFHQFEGLYVGENVHVGMLIAALKTFLQEYYQQELDVMTQPFYFPFTEPSFEFALSCPFCQKKGCNVCSYAGWIELLGCGMIHPNVLKAAGIDPAKYSGFAWGGGIERLVMMKYGIEDIRHFHSGKLDFLRQFA